ncbi:hypothetical protein ACM25N_15170 [Roseovarius sp. C7]|uniref:hypothetical protein n=1 Tax=Roseovarius sp. C7 TaxID=3398643 RepID=UPI0039F6D13C
MTKVDARMIFLLACAFMAAISFLYPPVFGDENGFLSQFVNHEFLNFMGIIVTITLASTANLHLELRRKEKEAKEEYLSGTRTAVRKSAFSLIWALVLSVILVVTKPLIPEDQTWEALSNSFALAIILWGILVIYDITKLAFRM